MEETSNVTDEITWSLLENVPLAIARSTPQGDILEVNATCSKMYGYSKEEFLKMAASALYDDPRTREGLIKELRDRGSVTDREVRFRRKDSSVFWGSISIIARKVDGATHLFLAVLDVTERKKMEEDLHEKIHDMEVLLSAAVDREETMIALKEKIADLEEKVKGREPNA